MPQLILRRLIAAFAFAMSLALITSPARAAWHKAESERFVIYSDSRAGDLKKFGEMLEQFHVAMELETNRRLSKPSPSNRLTVYMVGSWDNLRKLYGRRNAAVGGFYIPRANGSVTFVPNIRFGSSSSSQIGTRRNSGTSGNLDSAFSTLLHEYAHHFLIGSARHAMPRWLSEGGAEYFSSARFNNDGSVDIGLPNNERAYEISQAAPVSVQELLDYELYLKNRGGRYDAFYGRSWLLYHYLRFSPQRTGQLPRYWQAVAGGTDSLEAAKAIFGDLDQLEKELTDYGRQRSMSGMRFSKAEISIGTVTVSKLDKGHAAMMDVIIQSKRGVDDELAQSTLTKARGIAAKYPNNPAVLEALAEAEYDAGNDKEAIAAANQAIAADKMAKNAYVQKGYALFRMAEDAEDKEAAFIQAMKPFEALNALEADHTQPLIYYYRSFTKRGVFPPESAQFALERATQLAPFDKDLAMEVAQMKAVNGDTVVARYLLAPVAADPHGGKQGRLAKAMMDYLATVADGQSVNYGAIMKQIEEKDSEATGSDDEV